MSAPDRCRPAGNKAAYRAFPQVTAHPTEATSTTTIKRIFHCSTCGSSGHTARNHGGGKPKKRGKVRNSKAKNLRAHYRLGEADYLAMLDKGCGVCGLGLYQRTPDVDHDHACDHPHKGAYSCRACVRGVLCRSCNLRVGAYERDQNDDADIGLYLGRLQTATQLSFVQEPLWVATDAA